MAADVIDAKYEMVIGADTLQKRDVLAKADDLARLIEVERQEEDGIVVYWEDECKGIGHNYLDRDWRVIWRAARH